MLESNSIMIKKNSLYQSSKYLLLIKKLILIIFAIRFCGVLIRAFGELTHPHIWRQTDTLGMSMRYYLRFTREIGESFSHKLLPAVLQSGDGNGVLPS